MSEKKKNSVIGNKRPQNRTTNNPDSVQMRRNTSNNTKASQNTQVYSTREPRSGKRNTILKDQYTQIRQSNRTPEQKAADYNAQKAWEARQQDFERRRKMATSRRNANSVPVTRTSINNNTIATDYTTPVAVKKRHPFLTFFLILLALVLLMFSGVYAYAKLAPLNPDLSGNLNLYSISSNAAAVASSHRIANVAIFGIDGRDDVEGDRSDAIMIGSADFEHNKLKVTSLMRDTYTDMAGYDYFDKLNAAYSLDGPLEAIRTINENFDTAITDYVVFDFTALVAMVNAVGGIDINVEDEEELYWINQYLMDVNAKVGTADPDVTGTGMQHLTGSQALAYARIRYTGNGDYDRTQRQRNILQQVVAKATALSPLDLVKLVQDMMPYIETSLRTSELVKYALNFLMMNDRTIEQSRLPQDGMLADGYLDGVSYIFPETLVDNIKYWYNFVYEIDYTPSARAQEISEEIEYIWYW